VHGWFFPSAIDPTKPVSHGTLYSFMWRQREREVIPVVTNRDLRRTWKTLAGQAGLSKEIRDRIQNHTLQDVSSKSYDRWNYMPEKRAAMKKWNTFVQAMLNKKRPKPLREKHAPSIHTALRTLPAGRLTGTKLSDEQFVTLRHVNSVLRWTYDLSAAERKWRRIGRLATILVCSFGAFLPAVFAIAHLLLEQGAGGSNPSAPTIDFSTLAEGRNLGTRFRTQKGRTPVLLATGERALLGT
jgi:hypothetical protein